jgi:hypothetical protein
LKKYNISYQDVFGSVVGNREEREKQETTKAAEYREKRNGEKKHVITINHYYY